MALTLSLSALKSRALSKRKLKARPVPSSDIRALIELIAHSPLSHADRLKACRTVRSIAKRLSNREHQAKRIRWNYDTLMTRVRMNKLLSKPLDDQLAFILNRHQPGQGNMYSRAHGKRVAAKLGREHYVRMGKLGAAARWHKPKPE